MTKLETVRALNDLGTQLQIIESFGTLQKSVNLMNEELKSLPDAIGKQAVQALEPLTGLRQDVTRVLCAYDQVTALQRRTLDELTQQMGASAAQVFEKKAGKLDVILSQLSYSLSGVEANLSSLEQALQQVAALPDKLLNAQQSMSNASKDLLRLVKETRPHFWKQALALILAGIVGAMLVATGQVVLNRLVPPSDVQQTADWANMIWSKTTPKERELLKQIANRPVN